MNRNKKVKGSSLIIVFIVCTVIAMILATSFIVAGNYNIAVFSRMGNLQKQVCEDCTFNITSFNQTTCDDCSVREVSE